MRNKTIIQDKMTINLNLQIKNYNFTFFMLKNNCLLTNVYKQINFTFVIIVWWL